jgi:hypothetical protein
MMTQRRWSAWSPTSWVTTQTAFTQGFGFLLFAIQAPLLGPRPFGLMSMVMIFAGFVEFVLGECVGAVLVVSIAAPFGLLVSSLAIALRPFVLLPLPLLTSTTKCRVSAAHILKPQLPLLVAATLMGIIVALVQYGLRPFVNGVVLLPILAAVGVVVYASLVALQFPEFAAQCAKQARAWL